MFIKIGVKIYLAPTLIAFFCAYVSDDSKKKKIEKKYILEKK